MRTAYTVEEVRDTVARWRKEGLTVSLVPTMGYLHEGHTSLMQAARKRTHKVVVSIFVNPTQFGPSEDLDRYPRDMEHDLILCREQGVALVFSPDATTMYPEGFQTFVNVEELTKGLCGASRPGHFRGVCTVVSKLFSIVEPDFAFFGQKDAQQLAVVSRMAKDLNLPVTVVGCPIVREGDGLAKSSRNAYLGPEERRAALSLNRSLSLAEKAVEQGERSSLALKALILNELGKQPLVRPEYVEIVDGANLKPLQVLSGDVLIALAAFVSKTRLIDNRQISLPED